MPDILLSKETKITTYSKALWGFTQRYNKVFHLPYNLLTLSLNKKFNSAFYSPKQTGITKYATHIKLQHSQIFI